MSEKVIGYILLTLGVVVILLTALDAYLVFTKRKQPIQLFNFAGISIDPSAYAPQIEVPAGMESYVKPPKSGQKMEIIPGNVLNLSSNLFAHIMLLGFIASIGGRLASIGTQLLRPIEVKLRENHGQAAGK